MGRNSERLINFREQALIAAARKLLIHGLECHLLALGLLQTCLQYGNLALQGEQRFLALLRQRAAFLGNVVALGQSMRQVFANLIQSHTRLDPERDHERHRKQGNQDRRLAQRPDNSPRQRWWGG